MTFAGVTFCRDTTSFDEPTWVVIYGPYLHTAATLTELALDLLIHFRSDRRLVG